MSLYEESDFKNRKKIVLSEDEETGLVIVPGQLVFCDVYQSSNGGNDDYAERFGVTFRLPKGFEYGSKLFAVVDHVGKKTWKNDTSKLDVMWGGVDGGVSAKSSHVNVQDGDLHEPSYNKGTWQIKASRRDNEGPPEILDANNEPIDFDTWDKESVAEAKKVGPKKGDYCFFMLRVWAQKSRERVNFTLEGVRLAERGTLRVQVADRKSIAAAFASQKLPAGFTKISAGAEIEEAKPVKKAAAKPVRGVFKRK